MSQMPQPTALTKCPICDWPVASDDRFCGACGHDLSAVAAPPADQPTVTLNGVTGDAPEEATPLDWPLASPPSSDTPPPVVRPTDIAGTDSGGGELPGPGRG
ncbi:zinc ribbon domain-containing protein, partial [Streptomyces scabiei]